MTFIMAGLLILIMTLVLALILMQRLNVNPKLQSFLAPIRREAAVHPLCQRLYPRLERAPPLVSLRA